MSDRATTTARVPTPRRSNTHKRRARSRTVRCGHRRTERPRDEGGARRAKALVRDARCLARDAIGAAAANLTRALDGMSRRHPRCDGHITARRRAERHHKRAVGRRDARGRERRRRRFDGAFHQRGGVQGGVQDGGLGQRR